MNTRVSQLDGFLREVQKIDGLVVQLRDRVGPASDDALRELEHHTERGLGEFGRALYRVGFPGDFTIEAADGRLYAMVEFRGVDRMQECLDWAGEAEDVASMIADGEAEDDPSLLLAHRQLVHGIPLWVDENAVILDGETGAVSRKSGEASGADAIAENLETFFEHFVGAGCFNYGGAERSHFETYWSRIVDIVPFGIDPSQNLWLQHLDRWYSGDLCR